MQFGGGGISYVPNQTPPAPPVVFPVTGANNGLQLNGTIVQLGGPLPGGAVLIEQDSIITIQNAIPNQRIGIIYDTDNGNQFLGSENVGHVIWTLASSDGGLGRSAGITVDPNTVTISATNFVNAPSLSIDPIADQIVIAGTGGIVQTTSPRLMNNGVAMTNGAGAAAGTLLNAPIAGNPTKWVEINDNGTLRYIPAW
jgi:hypothetical protein